MRIKIFLFVWILLSIKSFLFSGISEQGTGMLFGEYYAFKCTAPQGWIFDNESGVNQDILMALYPKQYNWVNSEAFVYGRSLPTEEGLSETEHRITIEDIFNKTIQDFHTRGHINYNGKFVNTLILEDGKEIVIYSYEGDNWGNYEYVGYIQEERSINFLVFNADSKRLFDKYYPGFIKILKSYKNLYPDSVFQIDDETFNSYKKIYDKFEKTKDGQEYEKKVRKLVGNDIKKLISNCVKYLSDREVKNFELLLEIKKTGKIGSVYIRPIIPLSVCFRGSILQIEFPRHEYDKMYYHFNMIINLEPNNKKNTSN